MKNEMFLCVCGIEAPDAFLREAKTRLQERMTCGYLYPQHTTQGGSALDVKAGPFQAGPLQVPASFSRRSLGNLTNSTIVLDLDGHGLTPRYRHRASDVEFLVPAFVQESWNDEQRGWLQSECDRQPRLDHAAMLSLARELVSGLIAGGNRVVLCDAIELPGEVLPDGFESPEDLQMTLMELNLLSRELSAEHGALILHSQIAVQSVLGGATALETDYRRGGGKIAALLADELQKTLEQVPELDWFDQERARVEEKMDGQ